MSIFAELLFHTILLPGNIVVSLTYSCSHPAKRAKNGLVSPFSLYKKCLQVSYERLTP